MDVEFYNTRFDPDLTPFHDLAKGMAKAFGYTAKLEVDQALAQLLRLRVAQVNTCSYCQILHGKTAREQTPAAKVDNLGSWWESDLFSELERAALAYCDALTESISGDFQLIHAEMEEHFSPKQIAEIAAIVINMNLWTRLKLAQGATPRWVEASS